MPFDYGEKRPDGQWERYPTNVEGEYLAPIRNKYIHKTCGTETRIGDEIAETYAKNPSYYGRTFCVACKEHYPISEFHWSRDGVELGQI